MTSDSDSEDDALTTQLADLPTEIKSRVSFFVCVHDREYKERWAPGAHGLDVVETLCTPWHGRGLVALSETDREWNSLCATHIFRVSS